MNFGHSQRVEVYMDVMGKLFSMRPKIVFFDDEKKTRGHLRDGRPVEKRRMKWVYVSE